MLTHLKFTFHAVLLTLITTGLVACGGGGGDVPTVAVDSTPPKVIKTIPGSEDENVSPGTAISITFSENIVKPLRTDIEIYPVELSEANKNKPVEFQFSNSANTLIIEPNTGTLSTNAIYEVTISKVKDSADNVLASPCTWIFATEGAATISTGATGVCGTIPPIIAGPPEAPQNVIAEVIDATTVKVTWEAPTSGDAPTYYQVEKTIDNKQNYSIVVDKEPSLTFTDINAQTDFPHLYRVTAGSDANGLSKVSSLSNEVIPKAALVTVKPVGILKSQTPVSGNLFGVAISYSPDGNTLAVGEPYGNGGAGTVQLFSNIAGVWNRRPSLNSVRNGLNNSFGSSISFSPDGRTLAVGEPGADPSGVTDSGTVQLFSKSGDIWNWQTTLISNQSIPVAALFGSSVSFSPDGNTLAIGATGAGAGNGTVELFSKSTGVWSWNATLFSEAPDLSGGNEFGRRVSFSPDGSILAIGEILGDPVNAVNAGTVQLFSNGNGMWSWETTLTSKLPAKDNWFGVSFSFHTSSNILAIGESQGDPVGGALNYGTVQLFSNSSGVWKWEQTLKSEGLIVDSNFGEVVEFSPDGNILAVAHRYISTAQLLIKNNTGWSMKAILSTESINKNTFYSLRFRPDGKMLAIGEMQGGANSSGVVNIYDITNLP